MGMIKQAIGSRLARYLTAPRPGYIQHDTAPVGQVVRSLRPGDIVLVDGDARISTAIKYLTQSTWSHSCLFTGPPTDDPDADLLIEADLNQGVIRVPLSKYADHNLRICRPVGVEPRELQAVVDFAESRLGHQYDLKNITDLVRYLVRVPWVPTRFRRRMITLGSGEPTRAICSTLIAEAYQSIRYPILPHYTDTPDDNGGARLQVRHHSLFVPGDFDLSPYFRIIKPTIEQGFDFHQLNWRDPAQSSSQ
ncbi:MAG: YiiX/YebB-like N1pC/P60 family cysteine hydrolase [Pseudomonadota bacterium]